MPTSATPQAQRHNRMLGALFVRRMPGAGAPALALEQAPQGLFLLWLAYAGLLFWAAVLLWQQGVWQMLIHADPTGLTLAIVVLFTLCTLWAGSRAWRLCQQRAALEAARALPANAGPRAESAGSWSGDYLHAALHPHSDRAVAQDLLGEHTHGPHEMAWWFNGIQLKLGLLGKVIGFSILALELGQLDSFDPTQSAALLQSLTSGLGIALLTTMTGLAGNMLLGLQLMRLDRFADALVADTLALAEARRRAHGAGEARPWP